MADPKNASSIAGNEGNDSCIRLPVVTDSSGLIVKDHRVGSLAEELLQMIFIFVSIQIVHSSLKGLHLPRVSSELLAGLIFGRFMAFFFLSKSGVQTMDLLSAFGFTLSMFLTGVKTDVSLVTRTGRKAFGIGISTLLVPMTAMGFGFAVLGRWFPPLLQRYGTQLALVAGAQCMTTFPIVTSVLSHLHIINSEFGRLSLSCAIICDLFTTALASIGTVAVILGDPEKSGGIRSVLANLLFFLAVVLAMRPVMHWAVKQTPQGRPVKQDYVFLIFLTALFGGSWTAYFQSYVLFGPYVVGLAVPAGPPLGSAVVDKLEAIVSDFLAPIFVFLCSQKSTVVGLASRPAEEAWLNALAIVTVCLVKIAAGTAPAMCFGMPFRDALAVALLLTTRGAVDLAFYNMFRDSKDLDDNFYTSLILTSAVATGVVPLLVNYLYDPSRKYAGYQKRSIMHLKVGAELRIVACIHRDEDIPPVIDLLALSFPTFSNPISVGVLNLIELSGRASPVFISHKLQQKRLDDESSFTSEALILAFAQFEHHNRGAASVNLFTAVSPPKLMHADICTLALDRSANLIIAPFHRRWAADGSVLWDDRSVRALNCSVLDMAPCSVAILIDRSRPADSFQPAVAPPQQEHDRVAVLFFGGKDDREALTYCIRMAGGPNVSLTTVRFILPVSRGVREWEEDGDGEGSDREGMLDALVLGEFVKHVGTGEWNADFREVEADDGPATTLMMRSMLKEFGLIVVGRNHSARNPLTRALSEWSEFPELGAVGDLLVSSDPGSRTSVLVVQQQLVQHF